MSDRLWMLLLVTVVTISIAIVLQDRYRIQSLEEERSACLEQKENLATETSQLKQQVTQMEEQMAKIKQQQHETARESRRCLEKLAALEVSVEELENDRDVCDDERDRLRIREKNLRQQHDDCRSQLKTADSTTNGEKIRRMEAERDLKVLRTELSWCKVNTLLQEVLLDQEDRDLKTEAVPKTGNSGNRAYHVLSKQFKTMAVLEANELFMGIAILNGDIFAVTLGSNAIKRFDSTTLSTMETLLLPSHKSLHYLKPCNKSQSLFVIDKQDKENTRISRVDPFSKEILYSWPVDNCVVRLSVTEDCHVIATCPDTQKIIEYTSTGHLVREIALKPKLGTIRLQLALKMVNGNFLVNYDERLDKPGQNLALLNSNGDILKSNLEYAQKEEVVYDIVIDRLGNILVASGFGRVLLFRSNLEYERDLVSKNSGIGMIMAMHLDEVNGRLFVCDCNYNMQGRYFDNARILVFDLQ